MPKKTKRPAQTADVKPKKRTTNEQVKDLEDELRKTAYNKRTQHHIGLVKAKIARLKEKEQVRKKQSAGPGHGYTVRKSGDATVILLGFPSAGKSSLLNEITNANSPVGAYEFTTLDVVPGVMEHKHAKIQILDVPGIVQGAASGRGRGKEVLAVLHSADLILILLDVLRPNAYDVILKEIYDVGIRINKRKPDVIIRKTIKGGIQVGRTVKTPELSNDTIRAICKEFRIVNAQIIIRTTIDADELIDCIEGNKKYVRGLTVVNKIDLVTEEHLQEIKDLVHPNLCISAQKRIGTEELKDVIFDGMDFIRVYCKEVGKKADLKEPLIMQRGDTIRRMCEKLHKDFVKKFKHAKVWGKSAKFPGQVLMLDHLLQDEDVVEIHVI